MTNYYKVLQVDPSADPEVIAAAYKRLAVRNHPDTNGSSADAKARMQALNEAYAVLSDPVQRAAYDRRMAGQPAVTDPSSQSVMADEPSITNLLNAKSIGVYLAIAAVLLVIALLGFRTVSPLELGIVLVVALLLVQPISAWLARRSRR